MRGINKITLVGNCGKDPEVRYTKGGVSVATLSVATTEQWVKDGQKQERTEWHRVVCWGKLADIVGKYLEKGRQVYIEGKIQTRKWEDTKGETRHTTEIVADQLLMLGPKDQPSEASLQDQIFGGRENMAPTDNADEPVPF